MARKIVAGNWKMNLLRQEAIGLIDEFQKNCTKPDDVDVMFFVPSLYLADIRTKAWSFNRIGAQNFHKEDSGAFTGEISIPQLKSCGGTIALIGHSERRSLFGETNEVLKDKVNAAIAHDFDFIFCCGEPLEIREQGNELDYVRQQLNESLFHLDSEQMRNRIIAYEPVWAIGTGRTATSEQAEAMHNEIRSWLRDVYSDEIAESVSILYGGSCNPANANELFSCDNVDGGLIGGASLKADSFCQIVNAY